MAAKAAGEAGHLYVHVPFCNGKCAYCAFYSERLRAPAVRCYLDSVRLEIERTTLCTAPSTIYFGGGTPSVLTTRQLSELCEIVTSRFDLGKLLEWTVEGNPGTFTEDKLLMLKERGVNRISIGAQSFDDKTLQFLGRRHEAHDIGTTVKTIRKAGFSNVGLDLIAAIPGVTPPTWKKTLERAIALEPDHLSVYCLSIEPGSRFHASAGAGGLHPAAEAAQMRALAVARKTLSDAGYQRYEISNYALLGRECRHNLAIWRGADYAGFGPAAASRIRLKRWTNSPSLDSYAASLARSGMPEQKDEETLNRRTDALERLIFGFRLTDGVSLAEIPLGPDLAKSCETVLQRLRDEDLLIKRGNRWIPTPKGLDFADHIAAELIGLL
ncbi:MAG: coproporphyrinogen III oxidase [Verrucomicrobia bacterium]|nr:coproporphyrinogen III oxidase [Verrucomicrobiota bacterium]